jgi:hypothetical protein
MSGHSAPHLVLLIVAALWTSPAACGPSTPAEQGGAVKSGVNDRLPDADHDCLAWTDSCVNCSRDKPGEDYTCSNIGITCQPKEVTCLRRATPPAKTEPPAKATAPEK